MTPKGEGQEGVKGIMRMEPFRATLSFINNVQGLVNWYCLCSIQRGLERDFSLFNQKPLSDKEPLFKRNLNMGDLSNMSKK